MLKTKTALTLLLAMTVGNMIFAPSAAAEADKTQTYNVRYNPTELASPDRAEDIIHRVHLTATELCWDEIGPKHYIEKLRVQRCLREVTQDLVEKIDHPNLDIAHVKYPAPRKLVRSHKDTQWVKLGYSAP